MTKMVFFFLQVDEELFSRPNGQNYRLRRLYYFVLAILSYA